MNRKRDLYSIAESFQNIFYSDLPVKITVQDIKIDKDNREIIYTVRLENKDPQEGWYKSLREQYAVIEIVEYMDTPGYSFKDLVVSKYLGDYESSYKASYRWWDVHREEIIKKLKNEYAKKTMRPKSREAFEDILTNLDESKNRDKYIFFLRVLRENPKAYYSEERALYSYKKISEMTDDEKKLLKMMKQYKTTPGMKAYELQHYNSGKVRYRLAFIINSLSDVKDLIKTYKITFKSLEEDLPVKPETKKHFGDIFTALQESRQQKEKFIFLIKIYKPRGTEVAYADYKHMRLEGLNDKDKEIVENLVNHKVNYKHGLYEDDKDIDVRLGNYIGKYSTVIAFIGPKDKVNKEFLDYKNYIYGTRMKEELDLKPKTKEHFSDILSSLKEGTERKEPLWVMSFTYTDNDDDDSVMQVKYWLQPLSDLRGKRLKLYKEALQFPISSSWSNQYRGVRVYNQWKGDFNNSMFTGSEKQLRKIQKSYIEFQTQPGVYEFIPDELPLKPETKKHFGDIFDTLGESDKNYFKEVLQEYF